MMGCWHIDGREKEGDSIKATVAAQENINARGCRRLPKNRDILRFRKFVEPQVELEQAFFEALVQYALIHKISVE